MSLARYLPVMRRGEADKGSFGRGTKETEWSGDDVLVHRK